MRVLVLALLGVSAASAAIFANVEEFEVRRLASKMTDR
jgi:hypothetical protein